MRRAQLFFKALDDKFIEKISDLLKIKSTFLPQDRFEKSGYDLFQSGKNINVKLNGIGLAAFKTKSDSDVDIGVSLADPNGQIIGAITATLGRRVVG